MSVLFFWKGDNYMKDMKSGKAYELNQDNELMFNLKPGEHIWAFTRRLDKTYVLAADLVVVSTKTNQLGDPGREYGKFQAICNKNSSRYFEVLKCPDITNDIRRLSFAPSAKILGSSFQGLNGVRELTSSDELMLTTCSNGLPEI